MTTVAMTMTGMCHAWNMGALCRTMDHWASSSTGDRGNLLGFGVESAAVSQKTAVVIEGVAWL